MWVKYRQEGDYFSNSRFKLIYLVILRKEWVESCFYRVSVLQGLFSSLSFSFLSFLLLLLSFFSFFFYFAKGILTLERWHERGRVGIRGQIPSTF